MSSFSDKLNGLAGNKNLIAEIKQRCSYSEIRAIINRWIALRKTFDDSLDPEVVEIFKPKVGVAEAAALATYLQSATVIKKKSTLDVMSYVTEKSTAITIGQEKVVFHSGEKKIEVDSTGGILGGPDGPQIVTQAMSVCSRYVAAGKEHNKKYTFHADNKFAPKDGMIVTMTQLSEMKGITPTELDRQAQKISEATDKQYETVMDIYNLGCPTLNVDGKEEKLVELLQTQEETEDGTVTSRDVAGRQPVPVRYLIRGEYTNMAKQVSIYQMGSKFPAMKRLGRKAWTGTPIDNLPCDHVVALHDAGVPVDSKILVVSADTNLLTTLRSNFGSGVMGVGTGCPQQVPESEAHLWTFDYVYYPTPIVMNATSSFSKACSDVLSKMLKVFRVHAVGKVICHISPLIFYCKEFCDAFGAPYVASDKTVTLAIQKDQGKVEAKHFKPTKTTNYPIIKDGANAALRDDIKYAEYISKNPHLYHKLKKITTFTQLAWGAFKHGKETVPAAITGLSRYGTVMWGASTGLYYPQLFGHMIGYLRDIYKSIWFMGHTSPHTYEIRLFVPGAVVENLEFCDEYSALYTKSVKAQFEEEDQKGVIVLEARGEAKEEEERPHKEKDKPRIIKKKAVEVDFDDE